MPRVLIASAAMQDNGLPRNIGDEALTVGLTRGLESRGLEVRASLNGRSSSEPRGDDSRVDLSKPRTLLREIASADVVVLGGGTLLAQNTPRSNLPSGLPRYVGVVASLARVMGKPTVIVGVGAENWPSGMNGLLLRRAVRGASHVSTRDSESARLIQSRTGRRAVVSGDTFFHLDPATLGIAPLTAERSPYAVVALSGRTSTEDIAVSVAAILRLGPERVVLRRMDQNGDDDLAAILVTEELRRHSISVTTPPFVARWEDVFTETAGAQFVLASRLHALIFAAQAGTPAIAVGPNPKLEAFTLDAGIPHLGTLGAGTPKCASPKYVSEQRMRAKSDCDAIKRLAS
jgi:polysaccharide pyruvyl transferase WcaK-like protein